MSPQKKTSVWFLGTSLFAVPSLEAIVNDPRFSVDLVITQPDRPTGRKQELTAPPIKETSLRHHLNTLQPENINSQFSILNSQFHRPDFLVVVSFGQILSQSILDIPEIAPVNVHASLLPRWRGASPLQHAVFSGDRESGVTIQKIVKELDAGPILAQERVTLNARETAVTLHDKLAQIGAELLLKTLTSSLTPVAQDETHVTICRKLKRDDGVVDPQKMTAEEIDRTVRGLTPWPGVTMSVDGNVLKILETALEQTPVSTSVSCAKGTVLHLVKVQSAGGKPMTGTAWKRGQQ